MGNIVEEVIVGAPLVKSKIKSQQLQPDYLSLMESLVAKLPVFFVADYIFGSSIGVRIKCTKVQLRMFS